MSVNPGTAHLLGDGRPFPDGVRIAIATARGRPYYHFSALLKGFRVRFDSILPDTISTYTGNLVLTTVPEYPAGRCRVPALFFEDVSGFIPAVLCGMMVRQAGVWSGPIDEIIIGIDPGKRSGLSVSYCGQEIESSSHSSLDDLMARVVGVLGGLPARRRLVRIGDGDMNIAHGIARDLAMCICSSFEIEIVDESRTSPKLKNYNRRGRRDVLSARYISRRDGRAAAPTSTIT